MRRFFAPPSSWDSNRVRLSATESEHALRVLRLKLGDEVQVFDGEGRWAQSRLISAKASAVELDLLETPRVEPQPDVPIILAQALIRREKMKLTLQKAVELGASGIWTFESERAVVKIGEGEELETLRKQERIVIEAMKQCGVNRKPHLAVFSSLEALLRTIDDSYRRIFFWEEAESPPVKDFFGESRPSGVVVIVGPEGGFSRSEAAVAEKDQCVVTSLGKRILRAETAALVALTIVQFLWGDL